MKKSILFVFILLISSHSYSSSQGDTTIQKDYYSALQLYQQQNYTLARETLKKNFRLDSASTYLYALTFYDSMHIQNKDEYRYALLAAKKGNIYAITSLSKSRSLGNSNKWKSFIIPILHVLAESGDIRAMRVLSILDMENYFHWIEKAANADDGYAQYKLARLYEIGEGWFFTSARRKNKISDLKLQSAKNGYDKAIIDIGMNHFNSGEIKKAESTWLPLIKNGNANAILALAITYKNTSNQHINNNLIKSAFYYKIYFNSIIGERDNFYGHHFNSYKKTLKKLTEEEVNIVNNNFNNYIKTHSVQYSNDIDYRYDLPEMYLDDLYHLVSNL